MKSFKILVFLFGACVAYDPPCEASAKIEQGVVCGRKIRAGNGDTLVSFLNIPYARAPLGKLRFAEPQSPDPFTGVYNATVRGSVCPQIPDAPGVIMDPVSVGEDCLHVNVHVPLSSLPDPGVVNTKPLSKVLFYVHGGAFEAGSGDPDAHGPEFLGAKGIMLVTLNYRLGPMGFLSLDPKYIPGNAGLRDIVFAMKWVKRNIRSFGGDPDEITLGGMSAGATLAHLVAISPAVKGLGLFKRVAIMSGTAVSDFFSTSPLLARMMAGMFLQEMGINEFLSPKVIHHLLTRAPIEAIMAGLKRLQKRVGMRLNFMPVIETPSPRFATILPREAIELIEEGNDKEYTMLISITNNECQSYRRTFDALMPQVNMFPVMTIPPGVLFSSNVLALPKMTKETLAEYFNSTTVTIDGYLDYCADAFYRYPSWRMIEKRLALRAAPTFMYEFGYEYKQYRNFLKDNLRLNWTGVAHTEDFSFIFRANVILSEPTHSDDLSLPESDFRVRDFMTSILANFIKTGQPTTDPTLWPPSGKKLEFLNISEPFVYNFQPTSSKKMKKKRFFDRIIKLSKTGY